MVTIAIMMSGPHRLGLLERAIDSIPIESPWISTVLLRHQGGPWDWGGELRERIEQHPKVRVVEFPDWVDLEESLNRTLDKVETPWAMLLPDDDFLLRDAAAAAFKSLADFPAAIDYGFVAFGWYFLEGNRYLRSYVKKAGMLASLHHTPKLCSTLLNVKHVRKLGGFAKVGGFTDTALFAQLAYEFDGLISSKPTGVFRIHEGQVSADREKAYALHVEATVRMLRPYAKNTRQSQALRHQLDKYAKGCDRPLRSWLQRLSTPIRSQLVPTMDLTGATFRQWSDVSRDIRKPAQNHPAVSTFPSRLMKPAARSR